MHKTAMISFQCEVYSNDSRIVALFTILVLSSVLNVMNQFVPDFNFFFFFFFCFLQMELKLRLMELNWQKSQCVKMIAADERTRNEVRVCGHLLFSPYFIVKVEILN